MEMHFRMLTGANQYPGRGSVKNRFARSWTPRPFLRVKTRNLPKNPFYCFTYRVPPPPTSRHSPCAQFYREMDLDQFYGLMSPACDDYTFPVTFQSFPGSPHTQEELEAALDRLDQSLDKLKETVNSMDLVDSAATLSSYITAYEILSPSSADSWETCSSEFATEYIEECIPSLGTDDSELSRDGQIADNMLGPLLFYSDSDNMDASEGEQTTDSSPDSMHFSHSYTSRPLRKGRFADNKLGKYMQFSPTMNDYVWKHPLHGPAPPCSPQPCAHSCLLCYPQHAPLSHICDISTCTHCIILSMGATRVERGLTDKQIFEELADIDPSYRSMAILDRVEADHEDELCSILVYYFTNSSTLEPVYEHRFRISHLVDPVEQQLQWLFINLKAQIAKERAANPCTELNEAVSLVESIDLTDFESLQAFQEYILGVLIPHIPLAIVLRPYYRAFLHFVQNLV